VSGEIQLFKRLRSNRSTFENHWQRLGELMLPIESNFTSQMVAPGERKRANVFDSSPIIHARDLSAAIDSLLKPRSEQWFILRASDPDLNKIDEVKRWMEEVQNRMFAGLYQRETRFVHSSGRVDMSLVVFGTGVLFIGETRDLQNLNFRHIPLRNVYILRNIDGVVDTLFIQHSFTAKQADEFFGNPGETAREAIADKKYDKYIEYLQMVGPRKQFDPGSTRDKDMPFHSTWWDLKSEEKLRESGFSEFPFVVPVWDLGEDENYGRSPGMEALPDANTLNAMAKTILKAGQKAVDPPLLVADDSVIGSIRTWPGANTYFNVDTARDLGRVPLIPLETGSDVPLGQQMLMDIRQQIADAFLQTRLKLPIDGPQMTATEVLQRKAEFVQDFGPVFGRLETDYIGPMIDRVFNIMLRGGAFPPPPPVLFGRNVEFEYQSPISRSKEQLESAAAQRTLEIVGQYGQIDPTVFDVFDGDEIAYGTASAQGMPLTWLKSPEEVRTIREQRAARAAQLEEERKGQIDVEQAAKITQAGANLAGA